MNDDEPIIKLQATEKDDSSDSPIRLTPDDRDHETGPNRQYTPGLRVVEELSPAPSDPVVPTLEEGTRRAAFEGKSIDYTIDEILQQEIAYDPNAIEQEWGGKKTRIPKGWITLFLVFLGFVGYGMYRMLNKNRIAEQRIVSSQIDPEQPFDKTADVLVRSIDATVRKYLAADTIDEKIRYVRHAEQIRPQMEHYYARNPLLAQSCEEVTNYKLLNMNGHTFWKVMAVYGKKKAEILLLEQISDTQVLVDWDSHVDFEELPWSQYVNQPTYSIVRYRVQVEATNRFVAEFSNESLWRCYRITKSTSEKIIFGYVHRNSPTDISIQTALMQGSNHLILELQASPAMKARDSIVIKSLVSDSPYQINPP
ncbi:MAG: hypothetical protein ACOVRB_05530 [Akkermansiaceae bacterium]